MIFDHISQSASYAGLGPRFAKAFDFLRTFSRETPDGRYELEGSDLFALVQTNQTKPAAEGVYEAHEAYADIHFVFQGEEVMYQSPLPFLKPRGEFNVKDDYLLYDGADESALHLREGYFALVLPQDGHKPGCQAAEAATVRKVVIKLRLKD